ncbi:MAG: DUF5683 domain-containing protein [candidate division KSB1 bacterium]|nr:DUF5683 domain-containing protein [candidate division KSB1 bacterium]
MMRYTLVYIVLITALCSPSSALEADTDSSRSKDPRGAMLRSAIVPGWGQFYNGKWLKGTIIAGAQVGLITNAVVLHQYMKQADSESERDFYWDNRNLSLWWLGASVLYSMADAYVDAHLSDFDAGPELSLQRRTEPFAYTGELNHIYTVNVIFEIK